MNIFFLEKPFLLCSLFCISTAMFSCSSDKEATLEAEVKIANESVYVWNRGTEPWTGGAVFLNDRSLDIQRPLGRVTPKGFTQVPLREFKQNSKPISEQSLKLSFVWVIVDGYVPRKFNLKD